MGLIEERPTTDGAGIIMVLDDFIDYTHPKDSVAYNIQQLYWKDQMKKQHKEDKRGR